ncbi:MAG: hypothetical protein Fur0046_08190 [Cyanobacteria bacterium J069]
MKILRLTRVKCKGLSSGETLQLRAVFRENYLGNSVGVTQNWQELGPQYQGMTDGDVTANLYLESPEGVSLFFSVNTVSYVAIGTKIAKFKPVNPSITGAGIKPRVEYVVQQVVPFSAPGPVLYLLRPVFFLVDLVVGLSITLFKAAGSLIRLIIDPGNRLFVPSDDDDDEDDEDDDTDQKPPEENIPQ